MAIQYPIPQGLNETWVGAQDWLSKLLGNVLDPNQQAQPPQFQGMPAPPQSLPEQMAAMVMQGSPKEAYESGIVGMGSMPLSSKTKDIWYHGGKNPLIERGNILFTTSNRDAAEWYAKSRYSKPGKVYEVDANLNNPANADIVENIVNKLGIKKSEIPANSPFHGENPVDYLYVPRVKEYMEKQGYDGYSDWDVFLNQEIPIRVLFKRGK